MLSTVADRQRSIRRTIIEAVLDESPRLVVCSAPAGYGKSLFASELAARYPTSVECDCGPGDVIGFVRNLLRALGDEDPRRGEAAAAEILTLDADLEACGRRALAAWHASASSGGALVFENADRLDGTARRLFRKLLRTPVDRHVVIVCTRARASTVVSKSMRPNEVMILTAHDLRFRPDEIALLFDGALDAATLARVEALTQGWPLALEILKRAHRLGRLDALLHDVNHAEFRTLHGYMTAEVLAALSPLERDALCAISVLEHCDVADLALALGCGLDAAAELARTLPFVREEQNAVSLHPLVSAFLAEHHRMQRRNVAQRLVNALYAQGERLRAARLALDVGEADIAAEILEEEYPRSHPVVEGAELIARLERGTLLRHPRLWVEAVVYRRFTLSHEQWLDEGLTIWRSLPDDAPVDAILGVANNVLNVYAIRGEWERIESFRAELQARLRESGHDEHRFPQLLDRLFTGWIAALRMEPFDLRAYMVDIEPFLGSEYLHALVLYDVVARVHAARGDRDAERRALEEAVVRAKRSGVPTVLALCLQEAATAAWFAGEEPLFERHLLALEELVQSSPSIEGGVAHFLACARGRGLAAREGSEKLQARALSWLIAAGSTRDLAERRTLLDQALRTADGCRHPYAQIYARLAAAAALPLTGKRLEEARSLAAAHHAPFLQAYFAMGAGRERVETFLARFRPLAASEAIVTVRILDGFVAIGERRVSLSPKEFALLALLVVRDGLIDVDTLVEELWPNSASDDAAGLRVYVNRIRKRLDDSRVIVSDKGRYGRGSHVGSDLGEAEAFVATLHEGPAPPALVERALRLYNALVAGPPSFLLDVPALAMLHPRINALLEPLQDWLDRQRADVPGPLRARIADAFAIAG